MPRCSVCNKWGLFLKLHNGRCQSCHEDFMFQVSQFKNLHRILSESIDIISKTKNLDTLRGRRDLCVSTHSKMVSLNDRFRIVSSNQIPSLDSILTAIKQCENKLIQAEKSANENPYRRNWNIPLNEQFHTQDPSLSSEQAKKADYDFCVRFLEKVRNEMQGHPELNKTRYPVPRPIATLRSPKAVALRDMFNYPALSNLSFLDDAEYMYVYLAHSQAGRKNNPESGYEMNGFMRSYFPDHKRAIKVLFDLGMFIAPDIHRSLHAMTIPQLRGLLSEHNLNAPTKARKLDLIDLIVNSIPQELLSHVIEQNTVFELSDFGYGLVHSLYNDSGILSQLPAPKETPEETFDHRKIEVLNDLRNFRECNIEYYVSDCALDMRTCSVCGEHDMVPVRVSDAIVGINAPPYHKGCRCGIISYHGEQISSTRSARDPVTNKTYLTTSQTYSEWIQRISSGLR